MENLTKLNEAFCSFTQASKDLETYYKSLHEQIQSLNTELEGKNSELGSAMLEVKETKDYLHAVLQSIGEAIVVLGQDEKITMINRAAEELFCISTNDAIGMEFDDLEFSITDNGGPDTSLTTIQGKTYNMILSHSTVSDSQGSVRGHVILLKDITRLKELEQQQERNLRLIAMGEMAATIVHEIRSPLCSIELFSNMLSDDLKGTPHTEMAQGISTNIKSLNNILTNMLFFAKPHKPLFKDVKLNSIIDEAANMLAPLMKIRGVKLISMISNEIITGDPELLKQVFMNILLNAIQAMSDGGTLKITINPPMTGSKVQEFSSKTIRPTKKAFLSNEEFVTVAVSDEGPGIHLENIEKIFDPFFSTKDKGTGLGLTIASKIMQSHEGFIKAYNNEEKGGTFCLCFPKKQLCGPVDTQRPETLNQFKEVYG